MKKLKTTIPLLLIIVLAAVSCKNIFRKDLSMTVKEYYLLGMPDADSAWNENSYVKAHITLSNIRIKNFAHLPRKGSKRSGTVFNRILSKDYLSFLNDSSKSLRDKAFQIQSLSSFLNELARMYTDNLHQKQYYNEELTEIFCFELYVKERMLELADRIKNSDDPADISMEQGRPAIISGYVNLISILIRNLDKTNAFSSGEIKRIGREVSISISSNMKYLDKASKQKITSEITSFTKKTRSGHMRKDFEEVLNSLKE